MTTPGMANNGPATEGPAAAQAQPNASRMWCFQTNIKDGKLGEYQRYHDNIWPEVTRGLRDVAGILRLEIFRLPATNNLVMIVESDPGVADLDVSFLDS